uniref:autotransporter outer membrane beta-barrel domain-containing protein n=1 Tax=Pseudomonas aeruginosa TaxID=287 RepID=UPI000EB5231C
GTVISEGVLQVGDGGEKGSLQGDVQNDARLAFNHSADRIFAGNVTGAGLLMKQGSGTLALTGDHQHSGGTVISEGVLQVGDGGEKGSLQGDVQNDSSLVFNRGNYLEFGGRIDGVGSLVKDGVGLLNLTGEGSMSGRTYVQRGGLGFNGLYDSTDVLVNRDAYVYGVGRVGSLSLDAGGMIKPGNSIGTFSVLGDAIFNKGSVYSVEVNAHGDSDMINVGGVAYLYGGDVLVDAESGDYRPENLYKILLAEGGVEGEFDSVSANFAFLEPHLKYTDSNVLLALARNDLRPVDLCVTENQKAVCGELLPLHPAVSSSDGEEEQKGRPDASDNARPSDKASGNLLAQESAVIIGMSRPEFMELSTSLTGEIHPSVQTVLLRDSSLLRDSAFGRLHETEKGAAGLGSWGYAFGSDGRQRAGHGVSSINHSTHGFVLGQDVLIDDDLVLGVVGGYQKASMSQGLASADINTYNIGVFGSKRYNSVSMRLGGALSWHEIETKRKIYYRSSVVTPNADYSGHSAQLFSEFAYDLKFDQLRVEPYVGLSYTRLDVSSFSEDKKLFSLSGQGEAQDVYASKLGARANYSVEYNNDISVDLQLGAAWKHLLSDVEPSTDMKFQSYGSDMRISGLPLMKDTAQLTVRLAAQSKSGVSVGLDYILEKAGGLQDQSVSVSASIPF